MLADVDAEELLGRQEKAPLTLLIVSEKVPDGDAADEDAAERVDEVAVEMVPVHCKFISFFSCFVFCTSTLCFQQRTRR